MTKEERRGTLMAALEIAGALAVFLALLFTLASGLGVMAGLLVEIITNAPI